jgi:TolA-binding protein
MLKIGYCQYELKRYGPARETLTRLTQEYPETPAAAEGKARLERLGTEGR